MILANPPGIKISNGKIQHFVKAGSRWGFTAGTAQKLSFKPYPFWLGYASSLIKRDTPAVVRTIDAVALEWTDQQFIDEVCKWNPDLVLLESPTIGIMDDIKLAEDLRNQASTQIAFAGSHVSGYGPIKFLKENKFIDYALFGEYENTLKELILALCSGEAIKNVKGIAFRSNGTIYQNSPGSLIENLDYLPWPDRDDLPPKLYRESFCARIPNAQMLSSRGCPSGCVFCIERWVMYDSPLYRVRNTKSVVDEMEFLAKQFNAKEIYFDDQSFTVSKRHVNAICEEIMSRGLDVEWSCMGDAMFIQYQTLKKMRDSGCTGMKFGVEVANTETLKGIGKPLNLERVRQVAKWLRELGIRSHATFMFGLPGENKQDLSNTLRFALSLDVDSIQLSIATPFPGTPFFNLAETKKWLLTHDWNLFDGSRKGVVSYPQLSTEEILQIYHRARGMYALKKYVKHPTYVFNKIQELYAEGGLSHCVKSASSMVNWIVLGIEGHY